MSIVHLTDSNFKQEVLDANTLAVVDFWAPWCGPCKMIAPAVEELAKEYSGKVKIGKLDVDSNPKTATNYAVMSIPTLIFFKKGLVMEQAVGALSKADIKKKIEANL